MRIQPPALLPILRSQHQARLLTWLLLHPKDEYALGELAGLLQIAPSTMHQEVERLVRAGLVADRQVGRNRLLRANTNSRLIPALTDLLTMSFGPSVVVGEEFADVSGVDQVLIYGSWAERYSGSEGPEPGDVDVMVIGKLDRDEVYAAADRAQARLGIPVNPTIRTSSSWKAANDALVAAIKNSAHITLIGEGIGSAA